MSIETQPAPASEQFTKPLASEIIYDNDVDALEDLFNDNGEQFTAEETADLPRHSSRERGARRVADILFDISEALHARADTYAAKSAQDTAYDSYAENISVTKNREHDERQTERAEFRAEKAEQARGILRGIGRSARGIVVRAGVELSYAKIVVGENLTQAKTAVTETVMSATNTTIDAYTAVKSTAGEIKASVDTTVENVKQKATLETELFLNDIRLRVESGKEKIDDGLNLINDQKKMIINEYREARDIVGTAINERMTMVTDYFKERKDAAERRKSARVEALDARKLQRTKEQNILSRTANAELLKRLEQRDINKTEQAEKALVRKNNRAVGRTALKTALKVGLVTGRETYDALKNNQ